MRRLTRSTVVAVVVLSMVVAPAVAAAGTGIAGAGSATAAQQQSTVTLTVSLQDPGRTAVGGAELTATWDGGSATATTASNGRAFLDVPEDATVEIAVDHPQYMRNSPYVVENATEQTVSITVRRQGSLTVSVEDGGGDPVGDTRVVLRADGEVVTNGRTNADGGFTTGTIERREYGLTVVKQGYYRVTRDVDVGESTRESVAVERGSVTLSFEVTDDRFEPPEPVADALIELETAGTFRTLDNGEATAQVPVNADLDLVVTKQGYETVERSLDVGESATTVRLNVGRTPAVNVTAVDDRVLVGGRTVVTVTDAYGDPVADAAVSVDGEEVGTTGGDGSVTLRFEEAGDRTVVAETADGTSGELTVTVVREATPTPTATATPDPTPTATETPPATTAAPDTGVSFPGFTPVTAVLAVLTAAALFVGLRRRTDE
ncbi:carboxypeptidase regulatory-like domain-containing protein [Halobaculum lipolyticum]|uniref:Carboxypeptidase regulatory-like domain-containing protein n=1 Tax=Halobaculum lipolyticum TaxID=3032001 RepID=A0ABD5WAR1_9EURY|nr:carboxypeptidase regulatory-like domain-containing protein [Halobaculum sp. DT31]